MIRSKILSTGRYLPKWRVINDDLAQMMDTSNEWIVQRTGIEARHWVKGEDDIGTSDLAYEAAKIALERATWTPEDLDMIVLATMSPDVNVPGSGVLMQELLGASNVPALDIRQQCTGFIFGLDLCDAYIRSGKAKKILIVGAEYQSRYLELSTEYRDTAIIFSDGAGACCIEAFESTHEVGCITSVLKSDGKYAGVLRAGMPARKSGKAMDPAVIANKEYYPFMDGKTVYKLAVTRLPKVTEELLKKANMTMEDIDMFLPHQANLRINEAYRDRMKIPKEKMFNNIHKYGNTSAASLPIALDEIIEQKLVKKGDNIMFFGLGAGLNWGGLIYTVV